MTEASAKLAREAMEKSRLEVMECEAEIKSIKDALKTLAMSSGTDESSSINHLEVSVQKVNKPSSSDDDEDDEDATAMPATFKIHLSSPIEERSITKLYDPLLDTTQAEAEGSIAKFDSIETSNALLTVEAYSKEEGESKKLGVSAPHDLLPLCEGNGKDKKSTTLEIAIVAEGGMDDVVVSGKEETTAVAQDEEVEDSPAPEAAAAEGADEEVKEKDESEGADTATEGETTAEESPKEEGVEPEESEKKEEAKDETPSFEDVPAPIEESDENKESSTTKLELPIYTLTVQLEYTPSSNDRRDALYAELNEVSKRKVAAINELRKQAVIANRATMDAAPSKETAVGNKKPAVKPGFLNKSSKATESTPPFWKRYYEKTIGPNSMLWVVGPIAKNYVIFAGVSLFIHFKGDLLALPAPV